MGVGCTEQVDDGVGEAIAVEGAAEVAGCAGELGRSEARVGAPLVEDEDGRRIARGGDRRGRDERPTGKVRVEDDRIGALARNGGECRPCVEGLGGDDEAGGRERPPDRREDAAPAGGDDNASLHAASLAPRARNSLANGFQGLSAAGMRCYVDRGESTVDFVILGSIEAARDGEAVALGGPRQRALLGRLLLDANRVVAADRLVDDLWDDPPRDAHAALQNQVSRLRKAIGDRVVTKSPGYLVRVEHGELDLDRFRELVAHSGATADLAERSRLLREADSVFSGTPLADVEAPFAPAESAALDELRLAALEARIDSDLERGRHAELVPELGSLIARQPLRERLRALYIVALYRSDRQAEALEAYRETKRILDEELGLEPSPALRELEGAILRQEPELGFRAEPPAGEPVVAAPRRRRRAVVALLVAVALTSGIAAAAVLLYDDSASPTSPASAPPARQRAAAASKSSHAAVRRQRVSGAKHHAAAKPRVTPAHTARVHAAVVHRSTPVSHTKTPQPPPAAQPKTTPATTTPATTTTPKQPPSSTRTIADAFDDNQLDGTIWYQISEGTGRNLTQTAGRLEFTFSPAGTPGGPYNSLGGHLGTRCKFPGDFDARVDFVLKEWPPGNGIMAILWAFFGPNNVGWQSWRWSSAQWGDAYGSFTGDSGSVPLDDSTGTLRLVRRDGVVTASFLHKGSWQELTSGRIASTATIAVGAGQVNGDGRGFAGHEVIVDFDNFTVTGDNPICPPGSQPGTP